jgi:hypothetical protein
MEIGERKFVKIVEVNELRQLLTFYNCLSLGEETLHQIASTTVEVISVPPLTAELTDAWDGMIEIRTASNQEIMLPFVALIDQGDGDGDGDLLNTGDDLRSIFFPDDLLSP